MWVGLLLCLVARLLVCYLCFPCVKYQRPKSRIEEMGTVCGFDTGYILNRIFLCTCTPYCNNQNNVTDKWQSLKTRRRSPTAHIHKENVLVPSCFIFLRAELCENLKVYISKLSSEALTIVFSWFIQQRFKCKTNSLCILSFVFSIKTFLQWGVHERPYI